ncbi:hypothetical protein RYH80_18050 [Halobaculum sp. MBLA0147]|uniref:hypothetical protein n=1 Tax=Halobaculum sp. MBLA0147 TaxID=3079934 RepID=UPI0035254703
MTDKLVYDHITGYGEPADTNDLNFDPVVFDRATKGLQRYLTDLYGFSKGATPVSETFDVKEHPVFKPGNGDVELHDSEAEGIFPVKGTLLKRILDAVPGWWDVTVIDDARREESNSYAVRARADCGGEVTIGTALYVSEGSFTEVLVDHTDLVHTDTQHEVGKVDMFSPADFPQITAYFYRLVQYAYTDQLDSRPVARDYTATKPHMNAKGKTRTRRGLQVSHDYPTWGHMIGIKSDTVKENAFDGRREFTNCGLSETRRSPPADLKARPALEKAEPKEQIVTGSVRLR